MITDAQRNIVRATVPVLKEYGETITSEFYRQLFIGHPELLNVFNQANQRKGGQSASLAASILMYAAHIDHIDKLGDMADYIANKHGSLEVQPEHYPIVGDYLLRAIRSVLGEAATDEVLDAWAAAYGDLADIFIKKEQTLYDDNSAQEGGWRGYKSFVVTKKVKESEALVSLYLAPEDGTSLPPFKEGQFLSIRLNVPGNPHEQIRQYSVSCASNANYYRISVGREKAAPGATEISDGIVSNFIHDHLAEGSSVLVHMPLGVFVLNTASHRPAVLLSGGTGITPMMSMLHQLDRLGDREVYFLHGTSNRVLHAFGEEVRSVVKRNHRVHARFFYNEIGSDDIRGEHYDEQGFIDAGAIEKHLPNKDADFYYCGPLPFLNAVDAILDRFGVPSTQRFSEAFVPDPALIMAKSA